MPQSLILIALVGAAYYPTLYGAPRADQFIYFYRSARINDLWSLTFGALDFNRTHSVGDYELFRPVLNVLLGTEKWLWGYTPMPWQATSLLLHLAVVLSVYVYARETLEDGGAAPGRSWLAFAVAAFFGTVYAGLEMVAWQHIAGLLLFSLLLVQALRAYRRLGADPYPRHAITLVVIATVAAFTYELGVAALAGLGLLCATHVMKGSKSSRVFAATAVALLCAIALYAALDVMDYAHPAALPRSNQITPLIAEGVVGSAVYAVRWAWAMFVPAGVQLYPGDRIAIGFGLRGLDWLSLVAVAAFFAGSAVGQRRRLRAWDATMAIFLLGLAGAYTFSIVLYRALPTRLYTTFANNSYYVYIFALLIALALVHLVAVPASTRLGVAGTRVAAMLAASLLAISAIGAYRTYGLLLAEGREYAIPIADMVNRIDALVRRHGTERDFSFSVTSGCAGDPDLTWFAAQTDQRRPRYSVAWVLYPQYERDTGGKYVVPCGKP